MVVILNKLRSLRIMTFIASLRHLPLISLFFEYHLACILLMTGDFALMIIHSATEYVDFGIGSVDFALRWSGLYFSIFFKLVVRLLLTFFNLSNAHNS